MALIEFQIDLDSNGNTIITSTIKRIDAGDEIRLMTATPGAALQWSPDSPFAPPHADKLFVLPRAGAGSVALEVTKPLDFSTSLAQCGSADGTGNFAPWGGSSGGFPGGGGSNRSVGSGGLT